MTEIVTFFIVVACGATLYENGIHDINDTADAAIALKPLATTYNVCEGLGFESGLNKNFSGAPTFYSIYTLLVAFGAGIVLIPRLPLIKLILLSQVANGVLLSFVLFYMLNHVPSAQTVLPLSDALLHNGGLQIELHQRRDGRANQTDHHDEIVR